MTTILASSIVPKQVWDIWTALKAENSDKEAAKAGSRACLDLIFAAALVAARFFAKDKVKAVYAMPAVLALGAATLSGSATLVAGSTLAYQGVKGAMNVGLADKTALAFNVFVTVAGVFSMSWFGSGLIDALKEKAVEFMPTFAPAPKI